MITPEKYPRHLQKMFIVILLFIFPSCRNSESRYQHSATTGVTLLTAKSFLVNSNVRHNFSGVATHSTIFVLRNDNSRFYWYQWRAIFFKLSEYSKLPPGLGCTAPSYLPPAPARLVPECGARLLARARGSIRHEEHFVQRQQPPAEGGLWVSIY